MLTKYEELRGARAGVYRRKSQESDERQILSLDKQAEICDQITAEYQFATSPQWEFEEKKSAKIAGQRPAFDRLVKLIRAGSLDVIVGWHFSRFIRNMQEGGLLIDLLHTGYLKAIVTKDKVFFPNDNTIVIAVEAATVTEYSRDLSRSVHGGLDRKATLHLPHGRAPLGYINNTHKRQGERDWSDDPDRLPLVRQVMRKLLSGNVSAHSVWKWSRDELKLTTPVREKMGGSLIPRSAFYRMLKRTEYAGFYLRNGEKHQIKGITPIMTEEEYWQIQDLLGRQGIARPKSQISTYSHYLVSPYGEYCGADRTFRVICDCGHKFSGRTKKECPKCRTPLDQLKHPRYYTAKHYYNVSRKKRKEPCKYLNERDIDTLLLRFADEDLSMSPLFEAWSRTYLHELQDREYREKHERAKSHNDYLASLEQKEKNAKEALLAGAFDAAEYKETLRELHADRKKVKVQSRESLQWYERASSLISMADGIVNAWKKGSVLERRQVLAKLGSNFVWDEQEVSISNPETLDAFVSGLKKAKAAKRQSELDDGSEIPSDSNAESSSLDKSDPACAMLCGMWDNVRTALLRDRIPLSHKTSDFQNNPEMPTARAKHDSAPAP